MKHYHTQEENIEINKRFLNPLNYDKFSELQTICHFPSFHRIAFGFTLSECVSVSYSKASCFTANYSIHCTQHLVNQILIPIGTKILELDRCYQNHEVILVVVQ